MNYVLNLPETKRILLEGLVNQLSKVPGMAAIVLGGSYAAGAEHADSDLDIGLYYSDSQRFSIEDIRSIARSVSVEESWTVTEFYEWGPWVNGGAWIRTQLGKVDFLYRNLDQVQQTIDEACRGVILHDYDQQPAYGFYSVIYLAETKICIPVFDPDQLIERLKQQVQVYPVKLKHHVIEGALWSAEFTFSYARTFAAKGDIYNTVGCLTRIASNLTQALFALNERYFLSDKRAMDTIAMFPKLPTGYTEQIQNVLAHPGSAPQQLTQTVHDLEQIWRGVVSLADKFYQPKFQI